MPQPPILPWDRIRLDIQLSRDPVDILYEMMFFVLGTSE